MKFFSVIYILLLVFLTFSGVDRWPFTNFSVFHQAFDIESMEVYNWYISEKSGKEVKLFYRNGPSETFFRRLMKSFARQTPDRRRSHLKRYIESELEIQNKRDKVISARLEKVIWSPVNEKWNARCFVQKGRWYCAQRDTIFDTTF